MVKTGRPFEPGNKLGRGRPRGSRNKRTLRTQELLDTHAEPLIRKAVLEALKGDLPMLRMLLPYLIPRHRDQPLKMGPLPTGTAEELSQTTEMILGEVAAGKITVQHAQQLFSLIETRRRVLETQEFDTRLRFVEQRTAKPEAK